jgi:hypothetical protein
LQKIDSVGSYPVNEPMFLRNPPAPAAGQLEPERLGLADAREWIGEDGFHQFQRPQRSLSVILDPPGEILTEFGLEDRITPPLLAHQEELAQASGAAQAFD